MIGSLRGRLIDRSDPSEVLIEVAGVGYRVATPPAVGSALGEVGAEVFLHTHHHVDDRSMRLFGFASIEERRTFEILLGASGVGPSLALAILTVHRPAQLRQLVATDDLAALCLVPGVGRKTAARLLLDLKSKLDLPDGDVIVSAPTDEAGSGTTSVLADVNEALAGLGYGPDEIRRVMTQLPDEGDAPELIRSALRLLAR